MSPSINTVLSYEVSRETLQLSLCCSHSKRAYCANPAREAVSHDKRVKSLSNPVWNPQPLPYLEVCFT